MTTPLALQCAHLSKRFPGGGGISDLSLDVRQGEVVALLGPSGCGKTTTLRLVAGFEAPDSGAIDIAGRPVAAHNAFLPPEKRKVGMVFQDYALFPHLTVAQNVAFGLPNNPRRDARVRNVLSMVGLLLLHSRYPHQLSGGEQQRVALARALAPEPAILLLDEPFSNLDAKLRQQVREEVKEILETSGVTAVFVTHDQEEAFYMGHRVAVLNQGRLEQAGTPEDIYHHPATAFVARFVGVADFLAVVSQSGAPVTDAGPIPPGNIEALEDGLEVMVRPDDVAFEPSENGQGRIISCRFQGASTLYRLLLDSGETVHALSASPRSYPAGARVRVWLQPGHRLVCFKGGHAVRL
ncbi:MAG: ABC transporter ATP-binding protein [SAR202 cluster bacterium]|nr:ABC transporter ATP-binding protein [SAR202 cluster bacterium]